MEKYAVVEFVDERGSPIEVVALNWLSAAGDTVCWPVREITGVPLKFRLALTECIAPSKKWTKVKVRVLKKTGMLIFP
jgi:hypothetical protein